MRSIVLGEGTVIFSEGEEQQMMYRIQAGAVGIYVNYGDEDQTLLTELQEGAFFGEMALLENCSRSATAVVTSETATLSEIADSELGTYFEQYPEQISAVMRHMSGRIRALTEDYRDACGTVAEMNQTYAKEEGIFEGLAKKIKRFVKVYLTNRKDGGKDDTDNTDNTDNTDDTPEPVGKEDASWLPSAVTGIVAVHKGETLFQEGEKSPCMYQLLNGRIGIYKDYGTPNEKELEIVEPDSFLGEMGLIDQAPRSATAVALEDYTTLRMIYEADLRTILTNNSKKTLIILRKLSARLRRLTRDYLETCRLIATLEDAHNRQAPLSAEDMALMQKAEEIWRLSLMDASASYLLLGMGV